MTPRGVQSHWLLGKLRIADRKQVLSGPRLSRVQEFGLMLLMAHERMQDAERERTELSSSLKLALIAAGHDPHKIINGTAGDRQSPGAPRSDGAIDPSTPEGSERFSEALMNGGVRWDPPTDPDASEAKRIAEAMFGSVTTPLSDDNDRTASDEEGWV